MNGDLESVTSESLAGHAKSLADYCDSGDNFQIGQLPGYCTVGGLSDYANRKEFSDSRLSEITSIYEFTKRVIQSLADGEETQDLISKLEVKIVNDIEKHRRLPNRDVNGLLEGISGNLNVNKGSYAGKLNWNGRMLYSILQRKNQPYRQLDTMLDDYKSIQEAFVMHTFKEGRR